ncbi:MAG: anaerobic ribonucleoside-triphosphate reductase activating protein [Clostridia bacterium]|nr:anaerobic ribonucleoside-triphosphate reductase activating protein [Clostridia bacterium]
MNYGEIKFYDIANGTGVRTSLFVSGCRNCCEDCFNKETWDFKFGKEYTEDTENSIIESLKPSFICGLSVLGGEPFEVENQPMVLKLIERVKSEFTDKTVWIYSGFTYEQLRCGSRASGQTADRILSLADVLVDGKFDKDKKNISLRFRGSENQRLIDLKETCRKGQVVLWDKL